MFSRIFIGFSIVGLMAGCVTTRMNVSDGAANPKAMETPPPPRSVALDPSIAMAELGPSRPGAGRSTPDPTTKMSDMKGMSTPGMTHGDKPDAEGGDRPGGADDPSATRPAATQAASYFTCPMHPKIHQDHPGECPICGMKLIKKTPAQNDNKDGDK